LTTMILASRRFDDVDPRTFRRPPQPTGPDCKFKLLPRLTVLANRQTSGNAPCS